MELSYKLSYFLNLYFIFATTTALFATFSVASAAKQQQPPRNVPNSNLGRQLTIASSSSSTPLLLAMDEKNAPSSPSPTTVSIGGWKSSSSFSTRDKSGLERSNFDGAAGKFTSHPKPVNHYFSSPDSLILRSRPQVADDRNGERMARPKEHLNILYDSHPREGTSEMTSGTTRNNQPEMSVSRQEEGEDEYDSRSDNYEDDKIINPAALDNFFDRSSASEGGAYLSGGGGRFENKATTEADYEEETSDEGEEVDEDSYGEEEEGDILPVDKAFESFGKIGEETGTGKGDSALPYFLVEPQSTYVIKNKPAILKCKAANVLQVHFKCSGSNKPPPSVEESHVDPHSGVHFQEITATISRDLVYEYFGKPPFKCECHAWSPRGKTISQPASIVVAYIKKNFVLPSTKLRAEAGEKLEIKCTAPKGYPKPQITWLKNNFTLTSSPLLSFTSEGSITINGVKLQDIGNYTCVAENIAGKRTAEPIELIVYVNGGWSQWSAWLECRCPGKPVQGRKRTRTCSDPIPLYGGAPCEGPNQQKTADCVTCPEDTQIITPNGFEDNTFVRRWSTWSAWSTCSPKCIQIRRRICRTQNLDFYDKALVKHHQQLAALMDDQEEQGSSAFGCHGKDTQSIVCRGGECKIDETASDWIFYLGLGFIVTLCITFFVFLIQFKRHRQKLPSYSISRTAPDQHTYTHEFQKKLTYNSTNTPDINIRVNNYEYSNGSTMEAPKVPGQNVPLLLSRSISTEHHYDEPQFTSSYSTPIDNKNPENTNHYHQQQQQQQQKQHLQKHYHLYHQHHPPTPPHAVLKGQLQALLPLQQPQPQQQQPQSLSGQPAQKSGQYMSNESLATTSNTNTSNSTYAVATTESLETSSSNEGMHKSSSMRQVVTSDGGWLELEHLQTSLSIPEGALPETLKINVFLAVMYDSKDTILVENQITHISSTIVCGPAKSNFAKPLILKVPHCAEDISNWKISLFYKEEVTNCWKKIASSENDVPSPQAYIQLDLKNAYIMTRKLGKYILGGENLSPEVTVMKRLKIYMFGPSRKPETDFNIRVYILEDYPSALEHCSIVENRMGYFMIGQSSPFHFENNKQNMILRINCSGGWISKEDTAVQKIPFNHIWKNMSILHCEFLLQKLINELPCLRVELSAEQENGTKVLITSVAFS
ncbi:netrin receptor unc-5-like [Sabethes cyaneus]|uniref:netrin receptor unc-5-like n=1 Tax=Sabethes cyaneus TaxID=53552 RepID=UPI00237EE12D|nr:netrin receptor unc-5-like [Sabethes cyaneus]